MNQFNKLYNLILESIITQGKEYRLNLLKRKNWSEEGLQASLKLLDQFDNKTGDFLAKMIATSNLEHISDPRIKDVQQIIKLNPSIDTQNYNGSLDQFIEKYKPSIQKTIDKLASKNKQYLDSVPVFSQKKQYPNNVVIYRVQQSKDGMEAVRKIVDDQLGYDANPWCLIAHNTGGAWQAWNRYNAYPKHIAFQNGKVIAFCAGDNPFVMYWWDKQDRKHYKLPLPNGQEMDIKQKYKWNEEQKQKVFIQHCGNKLFFNKETGRYDYEGDLYIEDKDLFEGHFPIPFGKIYGSFYCSRCDKLTGLFNAPTIVSNHFVCSNNQNLVDITDIPKTENSGQVNLKKCPKLSFQQRNGLVYNKQTGLWDATRKVFIENCDLVNGHFPVKFGKVDGSFDCYNCDSLTTLEGSPRVVSGYFDCAGCDSLQNLIGGPEEVWGNFNCNSCYSLTSLIGAPKKIHRGFDCNTCGKLIDLQGAPDIVPGDFDCTYCWSLKTLKGAPDVVNGFFNCSGCDQLQSIVDKPKHMNPKNFMCNNCPKLKSK